MHQLTLPTPTAEETHLQECTQVVTNHLQVQAPHLEEVEVGNLLSHHNLPAAPQRWTLPRHPNPPKAPTPPAPWVLTAGHITPYDEFKPKILKEVDDFHGDSNDISCFFLKCELHFSVFNRHYFYHPHKVVFCVS